PVPATNAPPEPVAEAVIVIEPGAFPVIVSVATPADAVADPRPVTVPVPALLANVTLRELSAPVVKVLPLTSWIVAVRTRVVPAVKSAVEPLRANLFAAPATTVNVIGFPAPAANPAADALIVTVPSWFPVTVIVATRPEAFLGRSVVEPSTPAVGSRS